MVPLLQIQVGETGSHFTQMVCEVYSNYEGEARFDVHVIHILNDSEWDFLRFFHLTSPARGLWSMRDGFFQAWRGAIDRSFQARNASFKLLMVDLWHGKSNFQSEGTKRYLGSIKWVLNYLSNGYSTKGYLIHLLSIRVKSNCIFSREIPATKVGWPLGTLTWC